MLAAGKWLLRLSKGLRLSIFLTHFDSLTFRTQVPAPKALTQTQVGKAINIPSSPTHPQTQATRHFFHFSPEPRTFHRRRFLEGPRHRRHGSRDDLPSKDANVDGPVACLKKMPN